MNQATAMVGKYKRRTINVMNKKRKKRLMIAIDCDDLVLRNPSPFPFSFPTHIPLNPLQWAPARAIQGTFPTAQFSGFLKCYA